MKTRHLALLTALAFVGGTALAQEAKKVEKKVVKIEKKAAEPAKAEPKKAEPAPVKREVAASQPASQPKPDIAPVKPPASAPQVDPDDVGSIIKALIESAKSGKWALLVGFIMMLLTWLVNKVLKSKIPSNVLPWLAIGLSTVTSVAFALSTGTGWMNAIVVGIQTGLMAAGTWSALGKYIPGIAKKVNGEFAKTADAVSPPAEDKKDDATPTEPKP